MFDQELPVSYYEEISQLNKEHRVSIVRHRETGKICVKKVLSVYNPAVYSALFDHPVKQTPRIYALYENRGTLTVIEEYISGDSLEEILEICGPFPEQETIRIAVMLCRILQELHSFTLPLIHRDIKPSNIIVTEDGEIVLLDMNAAKFMDPAKSADTRLLGTPGYAAPEQFGFGSSTTATDLYAVGVLMDTLLSGTVPGSEGKESGCSSGTHISGSQTDPGLRTIIDRCRELDPARRYSSASDLARDLSALLNGNLSVPQNGPLFSHRNGGNEEISPAFRLKSCPVCGKRLPALTKICPDCGQVFKISGDASGNRAENRPAEIPGNALMDRTAEASENTETNRPAEDIPAKHRNPLPLLIAGAAVLLLLAVFTLRQKPPVETAASSAPAETAAAPSAPAETSAEVPAALIGAWKGNTGSGLIIDPDGTAVYYCERETYSEPGDPWVYADGKISVTLSKLHCVISADAEGDDFSELIFRSDSKNWDDESFVKLPQEDPEYRKSALRSYDKAITVLPDGQMTFSFDGLKFTVPKHYQNFPDKFSEDKNVVILSSINVDTVSISNLVFNYTEFQNVGSLDTSLTFPGFAKEYLYSFFYDVRLSDVKEETIAGTKTFTARFTGETNQGFQGVTGLLSEGIIAFFCNEEKGKVLKVILMQNSEGSEDAMPEMEKILYGAVREGT